MPAIRIHRTAHRAGTAQRRALVLALGAMLAAPAAPAETDRYLLDTGPIRIRDQFLPGLGYLVFDPVSADILEDGEWQVDLVATVSNTFAHSREVERLLETRPERSRLGLDELQALAPERRGDGLFYLDGEHTRWALAGRRGVGRGIQLELVVPVIELGDGFLDASIEGFHEALSFGQSGRLGVPRDGFGFYVRSPDREVYLAAAPGTALGDAIVGARLDLRRPQPTPHLELAVEALLKLPTGEVEGLSSSGSLDFGVQVLGTRYFRSSCLHFAIGGTYLGEHELLRLDAQAVFSGMLAWELALGSKTTALVQMTVSQSPFGDLHSPEIAAASTQLTAGVKRVVSRAVVFLAVTENIASFDNTSDIGLHVGLTRAFRAAARSDGG